MGTNVTFRALLCPHRSLADKSADPTWPRPVGWKLEVTRTDLMVAGGPAAPTPLRPTDVHGATSEELDPGEYVATLVAGDDTWKGWECAADQDLRILAGEADKTFDVRLVPPKNRRLLAVRLVHRSDPDDDPKGFSGGTIRITKGKEFGEQFGPSGDAGDIYAWAPPGDVKVEFNVWTKPPSKKDFRPAYPEVTFSVPGGSHKKVNVAELGYLPAEELVTPPVTPFGDAQILIAPKVVMPSGPPVPFTGARVTVDLQPDSGKPVLLEGMLDTGQKHVSFDSQPAGWFGGTVYPPDMFNGWPLRERPKPIGTHHLPDGESVTASVPFTLEKTPIEGQVLGPAGMPLEHDELKLEIFYPGMRPIPVTAYKGTFNAEVPTGASLKIRLAPGADPKLDGLELEMDPAEQEVLPPPQHTTVTLVYKHYITGQTIDENGDPMPHAVVDVFDGPVKIASVVSGQDGFFLVGLKGGGDFIVAVQTEGGEPVTAKPVSLSSGTSVDKIGPRPRRPLTASLPPGSGTAAATSTGGGTGPGTGGGTGGGSGGGDEDDSGSPRIREAVTDLAAYPVLTEEVSTTGVPAPAAGGYGGTAGAGYGQAVDQVIRDVLGWRPGGDVAGFRAALNGAFQLRDVEGHTEWTWQQRGYAVQADMGALTGAQASIYARAKAALDQVQPLLAGITSLNPALYPPEDLETIRTVISTELAELVSELALEGGPRIQRVNELFRLLVGESRKSFDPDPDHVQGQLGIMRARFGLTEEWVDTIDQERILTNFRVVVEQVLSLQESWFYDRRLLAVVDSSSSLGTILIWLSRGLEAVCESVDDLAFALDSVYVDAAQRQVIELKLPDQAPLLLSDLLDWVSRAARDEGPRLIQDAGRDGVVAFAPVLRELRNLTEQTREFLRTPEGHRLPGGMRTPRVHRAFQVLEAQLIEAARLARLVEKQSHDQAPQIASATVTPIDPSGGDTAATGQAATGHIKVTLTGTNFRRHATAFLLPANREDIADVPARHTTVPNPSKAVARFRVPNLGANGHGVRWQVVIANEDGTQSNAADIKLPS